MRGLPEGGDGGGVVGGGGGARQRGQELAPGGHPVIPAASGRGGHTSWSRIMASFLLCYMDMAFLIANRVLVRDVNCKPNQF